MRQGRHFLQIPGPSPVPDRVLRAMDMPVIDHRSAQFAELGRAVLEGSQTIFQTAGPVMIFPSSGTGAWEAAIVNTLSPGDKVLMVETGHFATLWRQMAGRFGIEVDFIAGDEGCIRQATGDQGSNDDGDDSSAASRQFSHVNNQDFAIDGDSPLA